MDIKELKYAYNDNKLIISIDDAKKMVKYYLDNNHLIELIYCKGKIKRPYWRKKINSIEVEDLIKKHFGNSESVEHYNRKMEIVKNKEIIILINDEPFLFKGAAAQPEYFIKIDNKNKFIDVVLLDEDNEVIIGIEIFVTNKKNEIDIELFNKVKFPIYEENINTRTIEHINSGYYKSPLRRRIQNGRKEIQENEIRIEFLKDYRTSGWRDKYYGREDTKQLEEIRREIEELERECDSERKFEIEREIKELETQIDSFERKFDGEGERVFTLLERKREFEREIEKLESGF